MDDKIKINPFNFIRNVSSNFYKFFSDLHEKHGEVFSLSIYKNTLHVFLSPTHIQHVLSDKPLNYCKDTNLFGVLTSIVNEYSLITTNNQDVWKSDRDTVNPFFHEQNIRKLTDEMAAITDHYLQDWQRAAVNEQPINTAYNLTSLSLKILIQLFFSNIEISLDRIIDLFNHVTNLVGKHRMNTGKLLGGIIPLPGYFQCRQAIKDTNALGEEVVDKCLKAPDNNLIKALAETYKKQGKEVNKKHLIQETLTLLLTGHETTANTMNWVCIYMSLNPFVQEKMHEEVINAIGQRKPTMDDLESFPYIRAVIFETLRLQPPLQSLARRALEDDTIGSLKIKKGDNVVIPLYHLHRLPRYWPHPEGFDPTRFLKPLPDEYKYLYIPFGAGPRSCFGRHFSIIESTIVLAMITQRYQVALKSGTEVERELTIFNRATTKLEMNVYLRK